MSVPARRQSRTRTRNRRSHHAEKPVESTTCEKCKVPVQQHMACSQCGMYKGRQVLNVARKAERLLKRLQEKARLAAPVEETKKTEEKPAKKAKAETKTETKEKPEEKKS